MSNGGATRLLGETTGTNLEISLDQLGVPGVHGVLEIVPVFDDGAAQAPAPRKPVAGAHQFEVKGRLSRSPETLKLDGAFGPNDGASYLLVPAAVAQLEVVGTYGTMRLSKNGRNELSVVVAQVEADSAAEAHARFMTMLTAFIDRVSYLAAIPIFVELVVVRDLTTEVQSMFFVSPPRPTSLADSHETLHLELAPVYALYREAQNASSPYYRVLCLFKIMEGLLGPLRVDLRRRAKQANRTLETPKALVPDHPDFPSGLHHLIGRPVKEVFDGFLQKQFRDAMAHFNLKGRNPLNVSDRAHWVRFVDVAFVAHLCVRVLVSQHEAMLGALGESPILPGLPGHG